jgi:isopentenyl-diphosphate delta-isomerase
MEQRKNDHITLAFSSQADPALADNRFNYEPMMGSHADKDDLPFLFLGKTMRVPVWISSMTGGSIEARTINRNLARACNEFGMGMGLGSCRILLEDETHFDDFNMRDIIGGELPMFANIGIGQLEEMLADSSFPKLEEMVMQLRADGLIIHVNPVQEWLQSEGRVQRRLPIGTIEEFLSRTTMKIIVKEVGQGMGPESITRLMNLPIEAFELAAYGGTNFAKVELLRRTQQHQELYGPIARIGHPAGEMISIINSLVKSETPPVCRQLIISGGLHTFLDGYFYISKSILPAVYGQASGFLRYARGDYKELQSYVAGQINGLNFAKAFLKIRE